MFTSIQHQTVISTAEVVIVVIGTHVDEHLNPDLGNVQRALEGIAANLADGQLLVLRSTVYPGVTAVIDDLVVES